MVAGVNVPVPENPWPHLVPPAHGVLGTTPRPICIPTWGFTRCCGRVQRGGLAQCQQRGSTGALRLGCRSPSFAFCDPLGIEEGERGAPWPLCSVLGRLRVGFLAGAGAADLEQARRCVGVPRAAVLPGGSCVSAAAAAGTAWAAGAWKERVC